jgi:hypothetical protein
MNPRIAEEQIAQGGFDEFRQREAWLEGALGGAPQANKDPRFFDKLEAIVGLYLDPPNRFCSKRKDGLKRAGVKKYGNLSHQR